MKVIGIDPGTSSWDIFGYDTNNNEVFADKSIPSAQIIDNPERIIVEISKFEPFDFLAAPSGFGIPIKKVQDLTPEDIFEITLRKKSSKKVMGLQNLLYKMQKKSWNALILPGIKHLPTIPAYRKINKIDMGTADKLCTVVVGIKDIMLRNQIKCSEVNAIFVELGSAFNSIMAIEKGKIIDSIGGSNLFGFRAGGALDGELAYLLNIVTKETIQKGGVLSVVNDPKFTMEHLLRESKTKFITRKALNAYIEDIVKHVHAIRSIFSPENPPTYILLSGKLAAEPYLQDILERKLFMLAPLRIMKNNAKNAKRAAQGAAYIAEGLNDGPSKEVVKNLLIDKATGHVWDNIFYDLEIEKN
ncbi:hypothetical protein NEF87_004226 [Candidatus Lokiarchaeum ossiferum]|uniref:DUF1464 domain-containing protein n=1 Tax=Candidatus Lokiarchaeum ossiferum TaxID=2951803 RepID=A0ABY6HZC6_9ARCH|nr:hypothetical protein NEF87_004226 [Candidatus Lokiarchaeum sp. B-35]